MKKSAILVLGLLALAACSKTAVQEAGRDTGEFEKVALEAGFAPETKVSMVGASPVWTAGDRISMFTSDGLQYALTAGKGGIKKQMRKSIKDI